MLPLIVLPLKTPTTLGHNKHTIGHSKITQLIPQEFSGVAEVKFITPINSLRIFWCERMWNFPNRDKTGWCNCSCELRLLDPQSLFGVLGSEMITRINS